MRRLVLAAMAAIVMGCGRSRPEDVAPVSPPPPPLIHRVEWSGQTLEEIAGWYTGKKANWEKLIRPVNPDLERCCVPLKVGREVAIPSTLLVTVDPMPKRKPAAKAKVAAKAAAVKSEPEPEAETKSEVAVAAPKEIVEPEETTSDAPKAKGSAAASGKVNFKGESWRVADAVAYPSDAGAIEVALSSKPFDRKAFAQDGKVDSFDVMRHNGMSSASSLTLRVGPDGSLGCVNYATQSGGGSSCNSAISDGFKLGRRSKEAIAGHLTFASDDDKVDLEFDVPVMTKVERGGKPLPAGGGEPAAAVVANFAAIEAGNYDEAKALSHPEKRKMMEENEAESKQMFELMKAITPTDVKILGGRVDGDTAILDFEGKADGEPVKGTIEVERFEGKWYLGSVNTTH